MVRVKLSSSGSYACCPSGDTEYEIDYHKAIDAAKPPGFEVIYPRLNEKWPKDSEGFTWVRLKCTNKDDALAHFLAEAVKKNDELARIKNLLKDSIIGG